MNRLLAVATISLSAAFASYSAGANEILLESTWDSNTVGSTTLLIHYEDSVADSNPDPVNGTYLNALLSFDFAIGATTYSLAPYGIRDIKTHGGPGVMNGPGNAFFLADVLGSDGSTGYAQIRIEADPVPPTDQLTEVPNLVSFEAIFFDFYQDNDVTFFTNTSMTFTQVPEPSTLFLFAPVAALLLLMMHRRKVRGMKKGLAVAMTAFAGLVSQTANAGVVTLQSSWFLPTPGDTAVLRFSFDDSQLDQNADPLRGRFDFLSYDFTTSGGVTYSLASPGSFFTYGGPGVMAGPGNMNAFANLNGSDGSTASVDMRVESFPVPATDQLSGLLDLVFAPDTFVRLYLDGASTPLYYVPSTNHFTQVPEPSTLALLVPFLFWFALMRRRSSTR